MVAPAAEVESYTKNFNQILDYIEQLGEVDAEGTEVTTHLMTSHQTPMREDKRRETLAVEQVLLNAPESFEGFFLVPKVVES